MIFHACFDGNDCDRDDHLCEGEVWSAGPLANTAWVRSGTEWAVVDLKTRRQVEYRVPVLMPPQPRKRLEWAYEVLRSRRLDPHPPGFIECDPERDIAAQVWAIAISQDRCTAAIHATRYADRASVSAKRLMELEK